MHTPFFRRFVKSFALLTLLAGTASAASDTVYRYDYETGALGSSYDFPTGFSNAHGLNSPSELNGASFADLLASGGAWGTGHSSQIRAFDWVQNFSVNYLTEGGSATWQYDIDSNNNSNSGNLGTTVFIDGAFDGQAILGNSAVLALDDARVLLYNPSAEANAFLSFYKVATGELSLPPFGFAEFSGAGPLAGQTFASALGKLIGAENGRLYYLDEDGSFSAYNIVTGATVLDPTWTQFSGGVLDGVSLTSALSSGRYLGIGNETGIGTMADFYFTASVPEPSSVVLGVSALLMAGVAAMKRLRSSRC